MSYHQQSLFEYIGLDTHVSNMDFSGGSDGKESACNAGDPGSIPGLGRSSGEGNGNPPQYSWPGEFHGQRSLAGSRQWFAEVDSTEQLTHTHTHVINIDLSPELSV